MVDSLEAGGPEGDTTAHRHKGRAEATSLRVVLGDKVTTHMIPPNGEMALGRGGDIVVPHVNISRRHLAVRSCPRIEVCDLGSTNLSMLHGTALDPNTWIPVRAGDVLVIGGEALVVFHEARCAPTRHMGEESLERVPACSGREDLRDLIRHWSARLMPQTRPHAATAAAAR